MTNISVNYNKKTASELVNYVMRTIGFNFGKLHPDQKCPKITTMKASTNSAPRHALTKKSRRTTASGIHWLTYGRARIGEFVERLG